MKRIHIGILALLLSLVVIFSTLDSLFPGNAIPDLRYEYETTKGPFFKEGKEYTLHLSPYGVHVTDSGGVVHNPDTLNDITNLAMFHETTRKDPLFYSPLIRTDELRKAIDSLVRAEDEILGQYRESPDMIPEYKNESNRIFPDAFLLALPGIIDSTEEFYDAPSYENAMSLLDRYDYAIRQYREDADNRISLLSSMQSKDRKITFFGSGTTLQTIIDDLLLIRENAIRLENETGWRRKCLTEGCAYQEPAGISAPRQPYSREPDSTDILPEEIIQTFKYEEISGPYGITSPCWGLDHGMEAKKHLMYMLIIDADGPSFVLPKLAAESYFWRTSDVDTPYTKILAEKMGINIDEQPEAADYRCTDLGHFPEITVLDFFLEKLESERIFNGSEISDEDLDLRILNTLAGMGSGLEDRLLNETYPDYADLDALGDLYSKTYDMLQLLERRYEPDELDHLTGGISGRSELIREYGLLIKNKLVMLPEILKEIEVMTQILGRINYINYRSSPNIGYAFGIRSCYSIVYFPFASSIWRIGVEPKYLIREEFDLDPVFSTYSDLVDEGHTLDEIVGFHYDDYELTESIISQMQASA